MSGPQEEAEDEALRRVDELSQFVASLGWTVEEAAAVRRTFRDLADRIAAKRVRRAKPDLFSY